MSIQWVRRSIQRLLPLTDFDNLTAVTSAIDELRNYEGCSPTQEEVWQRSYEISWPRWYAARIAVCHLYRAWWYSQFQTNNQFVLEQEAALRCMLEASGQPSEARELMFAEFEEVARENGLLA
ncbi:MAG: hypothetical protein R3B84_15010 [Zavarzinella sp.]